MKIVYCCYAGAHSSVIAGHLHLKQLPWKHAPSIKEILALPEFDRREQKDRGIPYFLGRDERGHEVYLIGLEKNYSLALQAIYYILNECSNPQEWKFFDTLPGINITTRIGGYLSRKLHFVVVGRYIAAWGIQKCFPRLLRLVKKVKELNQIG